MAYGQIITQQQALDTYRLLGEWREKHDPGYDDEEAELVYDVLRFVLQYEEATPEQFLKAMGFDEEGREDDDDGYEG